MTTGNRIVTLEEMIPALYRYATESYGVTIIDMREGKIKIVARFDTDTEDVCSNWYGRPTDTPFQVNNRKCKVLFEINENVITPTIGSDYRLDTNVEVDESGNYIKGTFNDLEALFRKIYRQSPNTNHPREFTCAWNGYSSLTAQRVDSDISRNYSIFQYA